MFSVLAEEVVWIQMLNFDDTLDTKRISILGISLYFLQCLERCSLKNVQCRIQKGSWLTEIKSSESILEAVF